MLIPSFTETLILAPTSVVNFRTAAKGAFVAGVSEGLDRMVTAGEEPEANISTAVSKQERFLYILRWGGDEARGHPAILDQNKQIGGPDNDKFHHGADPSLISPS